MKARAYSLVIHCIFVLVFFVITSSGQQRNGDTYQNHRRIDAQEEHIDNDDKQILENKQNVQNLVVRVETLENDVNYAKGGGAIFALILSLLGAAKYFQKRATT